MALNVFEPLKFSTQGITDLATKQTLVVSDGKITVETVEPTKGVVFAGSSLAELEGRGLKWSDGRKGKTLGLKKSKLFTDLTVNLAEEQEFQIADSTVLSFSELGSSVVKSNLKQLGTLKNLRVSGDATLADFAFFSSDLNRLGINTESPGAGLGIVENGVDIILGSRKNDTAVLGTTANDHLELITDNTARITISNNGEVRVHGVLYAEEVITQRSSPLSFVETPESSNYGKGILWSYPNQNAKKLVLQSNPDRIYSSENLDLGANKQYSINRVPVLSSDRLGDTVTESNLQKLGLLRELQVLGDAAVTRTLSTTKVSIGSFGILENKLDTQGEFEIVRNDIKEFSISNSIVIGNPEQSTRPVSVYGRLAIGVAQPDPGYALTVAGPVSFDNKKFKTGSGAPTEGAYNKGDIVWNTDPKANDYIGWVCVNPGAPGHWLPFGAITSA